VVGGHHGECGAQAYNGDLGAEPLVREASPPEAESTFGHWGACAPSGSAAYECKSLKNTQKEIKQ